MRISRAAGSYTSPTRERGYSPRILARASGWYNATVSRSSVAGCPSLTEDPGGGCHTLALVTGRCHRRAGRGRRCRRRGAGRASVDPPRSSFAGRGPAGSRAAGMRRGARRRLGPRGGRARRACRLVLHPSVVCRVADCSVGRSRRASNGWRRWCPSRRCRGWPTGRTIPEPPGRRYRLSRFAYLHRDGEAMLLESPTAHARVVLHEPAAAALAASLAVATTLPDLSARSAGLPAEAVPSLVGLLADAGMVDRLEVGSGSAGSEHDDRPVSASVDAWEFHDLLFHARSRRGRTDAPFGGTYRLAGRMEPPSPVRPLPEGPASPLFRPDLERLGRRITALTRGRSPTVRTRLRRSTLERAQLGEFLYRVARIRREEDAELATPARDVADGDGLALRIRRAGRCTSWSSTRPSPPARAWKRAFITTSRGDTRSSRSAGSRPRSRGPAPRRGRVGRHPPRNRPGPVDRLGSTCPGSRGSMRRWPTPWCSSTSGVVYQSMYLAATAMGLGPCAAGRRRFRPFRPRPVAPIIMPRPPSGEFLLGSRPEADSPP